MPKNVSRLSIQSPLANEPQSLLRISRKEYCGLQNTLIININPMRDGRGIAGWDRTMEKAEVNDSASLGTPLPPQSHIGTKEKIRSML